MEPIKPEHIANLLAFFAFILGFVAILDLFNAL